MRTACGGCQRRHPHSVERARRVLTRLLVGLLLTGTAAAQPGGRRPPGRVNCAVNAGGGVVFPDYDVFAGSADLSSGTIVVSCTRRGRNPPPLTVNFTLSLSAGGSGNFAARRMAGPGDNLGYNLYSDPNYTVIWGDGSPGTRTVPGAVAFGRGQTAATTSVTLYARADAGQNVAAGAYSDSIVATLNY